MQILTTITELNEYLAEQKLALKTIGFVPTMGALHKGHLSLVANAKKEEDLVICSIFVNPTQFNDPKDYEKYPRNFNTDIQLLQKHKVDALFLPNEGEIYPKGEVLKSYDLGNLETVLEGKHRKGHFQGVAQVVHILLDLVKPDKLYLGQKDFQQVLIIKKLVSLINSPTKVVVCKTVREKNGLAMSSRNARILPEHKAIAPALSHVMLRAQDQVGKVSIAKLKKQAIAYLSYFKPIKIDYIDVVNIDTLMPLTSWKDSDKYLICGAIFLGEIRLIDNEILLSPKVLKLNF